MYIRAEAPTRSLRSQLSELGELIIIGGENHKTGQSKDTSRHYEELKNFANETFTIENILYHWSTQDCMTLDELPYVGHFTSHTPNMYIVTGFQKWGMTNSIVSSLLIRDLITKGKSPWQDAYNPSRQTAAASSVNFFIQNLNVADNLLEGKLSPLPEKVTLKPEEAEVIKANGKRTGIYRDEEGTLHTVNTTCTHMGCELNWNSAEKTWDCPCHGSRFTYEGHIVEGPAVSPLSEDHDVNTLSKLITEDF